MDVPLGRKRLWDIEHSIDETVDFRKENFKNFRKKNGRHETMDGYLNGNVARDGWEISN